jgi:hypothetical protein
MDEERFARWAYPLLPMAALFVAGCLALDETGFLFPPVAVGVLGATAGVAVLKFPRKARLILAASEGFLWTIAIASVRAQCDQAAWLTRAAIDVGVLWGTVMAYLNAAVAVDRRARSPLFVGVALVYVVAAALLVVNDRTVVRGWPLAQPTSWLCLAGGGLLVAVACAVTWPFRHSLVRRLHTSAPAEGPYRQGTAAPDAPRELPSALWRYGRLLALAAVLPVGVPMAARLFLLAARAMSRPGT